MAYKNEQEALEAVLATVKEIEGLAKSMAPAPLKKDDQEGSPADRVEEQAEAQGQEGAPSPDVSEIAPAPEMAPEGEVAPEGQEGMPEGEDFDPASLSDEELHAILEMLTSELQKREAGQAAPDAGMAPPAPGAAPAAPAPAPAAPAPGMAPPMEDENKKLAMSFKSELEKMAKSQEALVKEIEALKKSRALPVSRPAATNASSVAKVEVPAERLTKSESTEKLLGEQRSGNRKVTSSLVADLNCAKTQEDLRAAQDHITKQSGVKFTR
jgi:hypothetical protein